LIGDLTIVCGSSRHRVVVDGEGRLVLRDHDERELIVEALGAPAARCRHVAEAWVNYVPHDARAVVALGWPELLSARGLEECDRMAAAMARLVGTQSRCRTVGHLGQRLPADAARYVVLRAEVDIGRAWAVQWASRVDATELVERLADEYERGAAHYLDYKLRNAA
jgi:hypothetical protein